MNATEPNEVTAVETEAAAPGTAQLTARALVIGGAIGAVACLSNLYVGLKNMVAVSVGVTACLVCYAAQRAWTRLSPRLSASGMSILEINIAQTTASAVGYSTGGAIISASAAHVLATGRQLPFAVLLAWTFLLSALGIFFALFAKRSMIDVEQLAFPTGTAIAETLHSLYARGKEAGSAARALGWAAGIGALVALWRDGLGAIRGFRLALPASIAIPGTLRGVSLGELSFSVDVGVLGVGVGALIGLRTALWMVLGSVFCFGVLGPRLLSNGSIPEMTYSGILSWALWPGAALLASASLVILASRARLAWRGLSRASRERMRAGAAPRGAADIPPAWTAAGIAILSLGAVVVGRQFLGIPVAFTALGIALSWVLAIVACRSTGETDITPTGPLGLVTQVTYGALMPNEVPANLLGVSISGNSGASAADFLSNLKAGRLLGADPRRQLGAQLFGTALGALIVVVFFQALVPDSSALGSERFPAPGATMALGVARLCASGLQAVPATTRSAVLAAAVIGLGLGLGEALAPNELKHWLPSPVGLGLSFLLPASMSLSLFIGAVAAFAFSRFRPRSSERYLVPISSGLIAGESVVAVALAVLLAAGIRR